VEVLDFLELFIKFIKRLAGRERLYFFQPEAFCVLVDIEESLRLFLNASEEAIDLVVSNESIFDLDFNLVCGAHRIRR
jgi:hypothetical protein